MAHEFEELALEDATNRLEKLLSSLKADNAQIPIDDKTNTIKQMKQECGKLVLEIDEMRTATNLLKIYKLITGQIVIENDKGELVAVPADSGS